MLRFLMRVIWLALALVTGLMAVGAYFGGTTDATRVVAYVLGALAGLCLIFGLRSKRKPARRRKPVKEAVIPPPATPRKQVTTGRTFEQFKWGDPPPSKKQFGYAASLGVPISDGMTRWSLSTAIDETINEQRSEEPATKEQLLEIRALKGQLPRAITRGEACRVIAVLDDGVFACPHCGGEVFAMDEECCECEKSLRAMKIPVRL